MQMWGSADLYDAMVAPGTRLGQRLGNLYAGSLYGSLVSLLCHVDPGDLPGKRIGFFSYGSGLTSTFFSATAAAGADRWARSLQGKLRIGDRLARRSRAPAAQYQEAMLRREMRHPPFSSRAPRRAGVTYLDSIDPDTMHRSYIEGAPQ